MPGNETTYKSSRAYFPIVWAENNIAQGSDQVAEAVGLPAGLNNVPIAIACSVTAIIVVLSEVITTGSITVELRKNGSNTGKVVEVNAGEGVTKVGALSPGAAIFDAGDLVGLRILAESGLTPNARIDLAVYLETQMS